jgi:hypothetical protein
MKITSAGHYAKLGQLTKERIAKADFTISGAPLWTPDEDALCRQLFLDRPALKKALKRRTTRAIDHRCIRLGLSTKLHWWTDDEIATLRRLYPAGSWDELHQAFPGVTRACIRQMAHLHRISRRRKPYKMTGDLLVDQFKQRCFELRLTLRELNEAAGNTDFLRLHRERSRRRASLTKALNVLSGELKIDWS